MEERSEKNFSPKEAVKQLAPAYIISFALCYMLFLYEPVLMYSTNIDDFWFDLGTIIPSMLGAFGLFLAMTLALVTLIYLINKRFSETLKVYYFVLFAEFFVFLVSYIQGNYLTANLPALDGGSADWSKYAKDDLITVIIWIVMGIALIFATVKLEPGKLAKYLSIGAAAVFVMLTVSLVTETISNDAFRKKDSTIATETNINNISSDKNFIIFMVDSVDARDFYDAVNAHEEYKDMLRDFTYYPDTMSTYAFTRESVPYVLTGKWNRNEKSFSDYCMDAYNNSELFLELAERDYDINVYDADIVWQGEKSFDVKNNISDGNPDIYFGTFLQMELKYISFKYLPYRFKRYSGIDSFDLNLIIQKFRWDNISIYNNITRNSKLTQSKRDMFQFIHAEGAHLPMRYDKDLNIIDVKDGSYEQLCEATAKVVDAFLQRLRDNGTYDNSVIIILSDHGYDKYGPIPQVDDYVLKRFNPILFIKGIDEKHDMEISDLPVSFTDLMQAYKELLDGKQSTELFSDVEQQRTRTMMWYNYSRENLMIEYETDGSATDWERFRKTGRVFTR